MFCTRRVRGGRPAGPTGTDIRNAEFSLVRTVKWREIPARVGVKGIHSASSRTIRVCGAAVIPDGSEKCYSRVVFLCPPVRRFVCQEAPKAAAAPTSGETIRGGGADLRPEEDDPPDPLDPRQAATAGSRFHFRHHCEIHCARRFFTIPPIRRKTNSKIRGHGRVIMGCLLNGIQRFKYVF